MSDSTSVPQAEVSASNEQQPLPRDDALDTGKEDGGASGGLEGAHNESTAGTVPTEGGGSAPSEQDAVHGVTNSTPTEQGAAATPGTHKKLSADRHVAFSPHVQIADMVLERPMDAADQAAELDVYERLYRRNKREGGTEAPKRTEGSGTLSSTHAATGRDGEAEKAGAAAAEAEAGPSVSDPTTAPSELKTSNNAPKSPPKGTREAIDDAECTFHPQITKFAEERRTNSWKQFVRLQADWVRLTKRKLAEAEKKVKMQEGVDQPLYDDMDKERKTSKKIIEFMEKQHLYHPPHVAWRRPTTPNRTRAESDHEDQSSHRSSKKREHVRADPAVFDKLYQEATIREAALRVMEQTQIEKEARELFRPSTNESYWHSGTILGARSPSRHVPLYDPLGSTQQQPEQSVVDELLAKGEEYKLRREQRIREKHNNPEVYTFKPATNENSRRIILQRAMERELERQDALLSACAPPPRESSVSIGGEDVTQAQQRRARFDAEVFTARMQRREAEKAQKLAALRRSLKLEEIAECTFRPSISKKSHDSVERQRSTVAANGTPSRLFPVASGSGAEGATAPESFSPDYRTRPPQHRTAAASRQATLRATASSGARNRSEASTARAAAHDHSDEYLRGLEDELRGVIAEWTTITSDAMKPLR